jgi:integrase
MAKRRKEITDEDIANLAVKRKRYAVADSDTRGLYFRITPKGDRSYYAVTTDLNSKLVWKRIERCDLMPVEKAREKARAMIKAIKAGEDTAGPQSFAAVSDDWLKRYVEKKGLRSADNKKGTLKNHLLPAFAGREFEQIRRHDVIKLLDKIEDKSGPVAADSVLDTLSNICRWYAIRHENYVLPIIRGMHRSDPKERARKRILNDDEIRAVWKAAEASGTFGAFVRLALLTAQRKEKVASLRWEDVSVDGVWTIPSEAREKPNAEKLPLPAIAVEIIRSQRRIDGNPFVFPGRGPEHLNAFSRDKKLLDAEVKEITGAELPNWTIHDLRRTARSLMSRAGVDFFIAERTLGRVIKGVASTSDRHSYEKERGEALRRLASLVEMILRGPVENVVSIRDAG